MEGSDNVTTALQVALGVWFSLPAIGGFFGGEPGMETGVLLMVGSAIMGVIALVVYCRVTGENFW